MSVHRTMQCPTLQFQKATQMTSDMKEMHQNFGTPFSEIRVDTQQNASCLKLEKRTVPRIGRVPRRPDEGSQSYLFGSAEEYYKHQYKQLAENHSMSYHSTCPQTSSNFNNGWCINQLALHPPSTLTTLLRFRMALSDGQGTEWHAGEVARMC